MCAKEDQERGQELSCPVPSPASRSKNESHVVVVVVAIASHASKWHSLRVKVRHVFQLCGEKLRIFSSSPLPPPPKFTNDLSEWGVNSRMLEEGEKVLT